VLPQGNWLVILSLLSLLLLSITLSYIRLSFLSRAGNLPRSLSLDRKKRNRKSAKSRPRLAIIANAYIGTVNLHVMGIAIVIAIGKKFQYRVSLRTLSTTLATPVARGLLDAHSTVEMSTASYEKRLYESTTPWIVTITEHATRLLFRRV